MSKLISFDEDKIINVYNREETNEPEPNLVIVSENKRYCHHNHLNIFKHQRKIYCKDCGDALDAFDALISFSSEENNTLVQIKLLKYQLADLRNEKEKLDHEVKNLKYQRRKLS